MSKFRTEDIRNVVLVGHGAVGKTTLADLMLFKAGVETRPGSVDDGTSLLDSDEEERERHFTITSAVAHLDHGKRHINLIDTPGYPDFIGQVIGAIRGAETAIVVINALSGIEVNTRKVFHLAEDEGLARMIVLNKCDSDNIDFEGVIDSIQETFGRRCVPLNVPAGLGSKFKGVVSTLNPPESIPAGTLGDVKALNASIMDAIVEANEELMERYLEGETLSSDEVISGLEKAIAAGTLIPIFCMSAKHGTGVPEFMDALAELALSPMEVVRTGSDGNGDSMPVPQKSDEPLVAQVFKTRIDPFVSRMSFLRIFSGSVTKDCTVKNNRTGKGLKIHQLLDVQGGHHEPVDEAHAGDIVAVAKVEDLAVGDTLTFNGNGVILPQFKFPTPMVGLAVEPKSRADQQKISGALHKMEDEDQTFQITRDAQTHEMVMHGMSELHLQIIEHRLRKRDKVEVVTHEPKIPYHETITGTAEGSYRHKKQSGGSGQFAEVHLRVYPLEHGIDPETYFTRERFHSLRHYVYDAKMNFAFIDSVTGGTVPNQYIPAVEKGVRERLEKGVLAGYQIQDVAVELFFGKDHPVDSNETAFRIAASACFRDIFKQARPVLLEPIVHLEIHVPAEKLGDITSDLNSRRGRVEGMDGTGTFQIIKAHAPLSEVTTYARALSSMTGGQGAFSMEMSHYEVVPPHEQSKIIAAHIHAEEEA